MIEKGRRLSREKKGIENDEEGGGKRKRDT